MARDAERALDELGPSVKVGDVKPGAGPHVDLVVNTELPTNYLPGAREICTTVKEALPDVRFVRVIAHEGGEIFAAPCLPE